MKLERPANVPVSYWESLIKLAHNDVHIYAALTLYASGVAFESAMVSLAIAQSTHNQEMQTLVTRVYERMSPPIIIAKDAG